MKTMPGWALLRWRATWRVGRGASLASASGARPNTTGKVDCAEENGGAARARARARREGRARLRSHLLRCSPLGEPTLSSFDPRPAWAPYLSVYGFGDEGRANDVGKERSLRLRRLCMTAAPALRKARPGGGQTLGIWLSIWISRMRNSTICADSVSAHRRENGKE